MTVGRVLYALYRNYKGPFKALGQGGGPGAPLVEPQFQVQAQGGLGFRKAAGGAGGVLEPHVQGPAETKPSPSLSRVRLSSNWVNQSIRPVFHH